MTLVEALKGGINHFARTFADMEAYQVFGSELYRMLLSKFSEHLLLKQEWFTSLFEVHNPSGGFNWTFKETGETVGLRTGRQAIFSPTYRVRNIKVPPKEIVVKNRQGDAGFDVKYDYFLAIQYQKPPAQLFGMGLISAKKLRKKVEAKKDKFVATIHDRFWDLRIFADTYQAERQTDKEVLLQCWERSLGVAFNALIKAGETYPMGEEAALPMPKEMED